MVFAQLILEAWYFFATSNCQFACMACETDMEWHERFCWHGLEGPWDGFRAFKMRLGSSNMDSCFLGHVHTEMLTFGRSWRLLRGGFWCFCFIYIYTCFTFVSISRPNFRLFPVESREHFLWRFYTIEHLPYTMEYVLWTIERDLWTIEHIVCTIDQVPWAVEHVL